MHFWKTKLVAIELKENSLAQDSLKNYYLATSVLVLATYYLGAMSPHENLGALATEAVACVLLTIFGTNAAYDANGGINGIRFLDKIIAISFPLLIKILVAGFALGFVVVAMELSGGDPSQSEWVISLSIVAIQAIFFWRLITHIKTTNA